MSSIALLLVGLAGGVYLGQHRDSRQQQVSSELALSAASVEPRSYPPASSRDAARMGPKREANAVAAAKAAKVAKAAAVPVEKAKREEKEGAKPGGGSAKTEPYRGPIPDSCDEYSGNRRTGCAILLSSGFDIDQMPCLDQLWSRESGWNHRASNPSSGAYGIPQALPGGKMSSAGADWQNNPATQIKWGLGYIRGRYSDPCGAWSHSESVGWY